MPSLHELGGVEVLRRLAAARRAQAGTVVDAGDDAAVLRGGGPAVGVARPAPGA